MSAQSLKKIFTQFKYQPGKLEIAQAAQYPDRNVQNLVESFRVHISVPAEQMTDAYTTHKSLG